MATKLDAILAAIEAQNAATNARIDTLFGMVAPAKNPASEAPKTPQTTPSADAKLGTVARTAGRISKLNSTGTGAVLDEEKTDKGFDVWQNVNAASGATFEGFAVGQHVTLTREMVAYTPKTGRNAGKTRNRWEVTAVVLTGQESSAPSKPQKNDKIVGQTGKTQAQLDKLADAISPDPKAPSKPQKSDTCPFCSGPCPKNKYACHEVRMSCAWRQFLAQHTDANNPAPSFEGATVLLFGGWIAANPVRVYAHNAQGYADIGGQPMPDPEAPQTGAKAGKGKTQKSAPEAPQTGAKAGKGKGSRKVTPSAQVASDTADDGADDDIAPVQEVANDAATAKAIAGMFKAPTDGTFENCIIVKFGDSKPNMVKVVNASDMSGRDGSGVWLSVRPSSPEMMEKLASFRVGDVLTVKLRQNMIRGMKRTAKSELPIEGVKSADPTRGQKSNAPSKNVTRSGGVTKSERIGKAQKRAGKDASKGKAAR